jgi:hypothetical protein
MPSLLSTNRGKYLILPFQIYVDYIYPTAAKNIDKPSQKSEHLYKSSFKERAIMPHQMLQLKDQEITMLRDEMEILMNERQMLLRIAGSAATLIAELDEKTLPPATYEAAEYLGEY